MKIHVTDNEELRDIVREGLRNNNGYCPCVIHSKGQPQYLCPCEDFRLNISAGQPCHCGLYIKDEA